jgi:hypothetical protein
MGLLVTVLFLRHTVPGTTLQPTTTVLLCKTEIQKGSPWDPKDGLTFFECLNAYKRTYRYCNTGLAMLATQRTKNSFVFC